MSGSGDCNDDDYDTDAEMARFLADIDAGREMIPDPYEDAPAALVSLGGAGDAGPVALAALCGPGGLDGFSQDGAADSMAPGPLLGALTEQAAADVSALTGNQLLGALSAARRLAARAEYLETVTIAEFGRRRAAQAAAARARKDRAGARDAEHAGAGLAVHLVTSIARAGDQLDMAAALEARLPATFAGMAAGAIDRDRAYLIWFYTRFLTDADAAHADTALAAAWQEPCPGCARWPTWTGSTAATRWPDQRRHRRRQRGRRRHRPACPAPGPDQPHRSRASLVCSVT